MWKTFLYHFYVFDQDNETNIDGSYLVPYLANKYKIKNKSIVWFFNTQYLLLLLILINPIITFFYSISCPLS